jgi:phosphate transport system substrate-binding protein
MSQSKTQKVLLSILILFCLTSCGHSSDVTQAGSASKSTIVVSGAWALYPMMVRWGELFHEEYPQVEFDISAGGAGKGMADVLAGAVDIGMVSRDIYPQEVENGAFWVSVTRDAVFLTVNEQNPVLDELLTRGVSREELIGIYITGEIVAWGQLVDRTDLEDPIHVYTRSDAAGAPATWAEYLGKAQEDLLGVGVYGDPGVLDAVIKDPQGIGYNNLNYAYDDSTKKPVAGAYVIPLDSNGNGQVDPEEWFETKDEAVNIVAEGRYPSPPARDLNLVTLGKPNGIVKIFIEWVLTDGQDYVSEVGYIRLSDDQLQSEMTKLE